MWNDLSMADRAKYIRLGVESGLSSLNEIHNAYNTFAEGGYIDWIDKVKQWKPGIDKDIDAESPTYDYYGFFLEDPERAWKMLKGDPEAHFIDKYKMPNHPTFSDESIYSTPETPGGHWHENYGGSGRWVFEHSDYTRQHLDDTRKYLENSGEGYLDGMNVVFPKRYNKFDGKSMPSNQMTRRIYVDPKGNTYDSIPEGYVTKSSLSPIERKAADEIYRRENPTELDELIVYPSTGKGAKSTSMGSYYDKISDMTDANRKHAQRVAEADALVRETAAFEKPLNFLSPGQWFGAAVDYYQGESPFWKGIYDGNSGWVPDNFAREHPEVAFFANMLGDGIVSAGAETAVRGIISKLPVKGWSKRLAEVAMRTTDNPQPLETISAEFKKVRRGDPKRFRDIKNYILYNSDEGGIGRKTFSTNMVKNSRTGELEPWVNGGINGEPIGGNNFVPYEGYGDLIDAGLYGTPVDPRLATLESVGEGFGVHEEYIMNNYADRANNIKVYRVNDNEFPNIKEQILVPEEDIPNIKITGESEVKSQNYVPLTVEGIDYRWNPGGHRRVYGAVPDTRPGVPEGYSRPVTYRQDIYKFLPDDYESKWGIDGIMDAFKKDGFKGAKNTLLMKAGLRFVDKRFTPSVVKGNTYFID